MKIKTLFLIGIIFLINSIVFAGEINNNFLFGAYKDTHIEQVDKVAAHLKKHNYEKAESQMGWVAILVAGYDTSAEYDIFNGEIELHKNNLDLSEVHLKKALAKYDRYKGRNTPLLYNELAKLYCIKGNYQKALEYSDKAMKSEHFEEEFIETRIDILKNIPNYNGKSLIASDDLVPDMEQQFNIEKFELNDNLQDLQKLFSAITEIDNVIGKTENITWGEVFGFTKKQRTQYKNKADEYPIAALTKAMLMYTLGYKEDGENLANKIIGSHYFWNMDNDTKAEYYRIVGLMEHNPKKYDNAINLLTKSLELNPKNPNTYYSRSWYYCELGKNELALEDIDKYIELMPDDYIGYEKKGQYLKNLKRYDEAVKMFDKAVSLNSKADYSKQEKKSTLNIIADEKIPYEEKERKRQLSHSEMLVNLLKTGGLLKRVQKQGNIMVYFVDADIWFDGGSSGRVTTLEIVDDYSILRGCKISDFKDYKTGKLLFRYRTRVRELPTINTSSF